MEIVWFNVNTVASTDGCEDWDENLKIPYDSSTVVQGNALDTSK